MPLIPDINSSSFSPELEVFRARIAANGRGDITVGGETVSIVYDATNGRFSSSGGNDGLLSELLILGFNNGPRALRESMLSDSGEAQSQESIQDKISQCKFPVSSGNFQCPPESIQCPITLERPEEGVFVKNSDSSAVCTLFDVDALSRVVNDGSVHPLTRAPITPSMIVKPEECKYDPARGSFIIKDS
ncbi:TPA: DUF1076 domain-containing protein [Escherichia coli]|nr:DUF1076 domain-containing protein [Escherichia coli]